MELGADAVEVFRPSILLTFADFGGVLAAQPSLETVGFHLFAGVIQLTNALTPPGVTLSALDLVIYIGKQVAFQHFCWAQ